MLARALVRRSVRFLSATLSISGFIAVATVATAKDKPVSVEGRSSVSREGRDLAAAVRECTEKQVAGLDLSKMPKHAKLIVSASLVGLDTSLRADGAVIDARVSITVRDGRSGALRAMLSGKAKAETMRRAVVLGEDTAIDAAIQSAMSRVPEVIGKVNLPRRARRPVRLPPGDTHRPLRRLVSPRARAGRGRRSRPGLRPPRRG